MSNSKNHFDNSADNNGALSSDPGKTGTVLRQPEAITPLTKKKERPERTALEIAEQLDWEVKTLPVWQPGDVILDTYEVEDVIVSGGMGYVYIANHNKWNVKLAIKSPNELVLSNKDFYAQVLKEANNWIELGLHPNIAYCYYVRNIEDVPHIVVEYVNGGNLGEWIEEGKCIDYRTNLDLAIQFCHGMEYAHSKGLIHRDIKPPNILMTKDGVLKIADFGLAKDPKSSPENLTGYSKGYTAPEQIEDFQKADERADIFSFGVCLYEMFCGNKPYGTEIYIPQQDPPDPIALSHDQNFPEQIAELLKKCVQWDKTARYANFLEIRNGLNKIYQDLYRDESPYADLELVDVEADGLNNQGVSYFDLGKKEDAISCWEKALEINQLHPVATYNLGLVQWRDAKVADDEVLKRLDNCGNNPSADQEKLAELKAFIHAERVDFDGARELLKEIPGRYEDLFSGKDVDQVGTIQTLIGHKHHVDLVEFTSDSRYVVSGSWDKTLRVWEFASGRCVHILGGHTNGVTSITLSPDSQYVVSGSSDKTIRVWNLSNGKCINVLEGHAEGISSVSISPDGHYVLSASWDKTLRVWELKSGQCIHTLKGHTKEVSSVAFTPDGRFAISRSQDKTLRLWELTSYQCINTLKGHTETIGSVAISTDGRYAVSASWDKTLRVWELESGRCVHTLEGHIEWVTSVTLSPDGQYAISGSLDNTLRVWELKSSRCVHTLEGHTKPIMSVAVSPDGRYAISGSRDETLRVWELDRGRCVHTLEGHTNYVGSVAISGDGRYAVSGSGDKTVRFWKIVTDRIYIADHRISLLKGFKEIKKEKDDLDKAISQVRALYKTGDYSKSFSVLYDGWKKLGFSDNPLTKELYLELMKKGRIKGFNFSFQNNIMQGHRNFISSVALDLDSRYMVSGSYDKTLRVWELATGSCERILEGHADSVYSVAVSPDGRYVVSGSKDKTLRVWELESGRCVHTLEGHIGWVTSVVFNFDGRYAVSGSQDKTLRVWELESGRCINSFKCHHSKGISSVAISLDDRYAVSSSYDNTLRVWELATGSCERILEGHANSVYSVAISPDGRYVVSVSWDKTLRVWELATGSCERILEGHADSVHSVAISPDGRYVVSGSKDKTLRVWELNSGSCIHVLEGHTNEVKAVAFSHNGWHVVSGSLDSTLRVWRLIWDLEFPESVDWDEGVRPYLEIFLTLRDDKWTEEDFQELITELAEKRGYGWVRPEGIRKELENMSKNWKP